ncbi:hypothetical protein F7725_012192, partial [Dissostichus mawsoni]
ERRAEERRGEERRGEERRGEEREERRGEERRGEERRGEESRGEQRRGEEDSSTEVVDRFYLFPKILLVFCFLRLTAAFPRSCKDDEYPHVNICCRNCPAGQRVASHCSTAGGESVCEECADGTFTEHDNGLKQCFKCAQCRSERGGSVLRMKPVKCAEDAPESQSSPPDGLKAGQRPLLVRSRSCREEEEEERRVLCESLSSSTTNSQLSLSALPPLTPRLPAAARPAGKESFPKLVPNNGDDSLRKCFQFFDELDFAFHRRFFRHLDVSDNDIKSKEHLHLYEDKIYALLNIWLEMKGRDA